MPPPEGAAFHAIHDAADAGARRITTTIDNPVLADLGSTAHTTGQLTLDVATMPWTRSEFRPFAT